MQAQQPVAVVDAQVDYGRVVALGETGEEKPERVAVGVQPYLFQARELRTAVQKAVSLKGRHEEAVARREAVVREKAGRPKAPVVRV